MQQLHLCTFRTLNPGITVALQLSRRVCCNHLPRRGRVLELWKAVGDIGDGATVLVGGGDEGSMPASLLAGLAATQAKDLTVVCGDAGRGHPRLGALVGSGRVRRVVTSSVGDDEDLVGMHREGRLEVELVPQGTLAESLRLGGAGIPAFYTPVGLGTAVETGLIPTGHSPDGQVTVLCCPRQRVILHGKPYLLEESRRGDFALVRAWLADSDGNLCFRGARDYSGAMCTAGRVTIAQVESVVGAGELPAVHVSGVYVDRVVVVATKDGGVSEGSAAPRPRRPQKGAGMLEGTPAAEERRRIARRVAVEMRHNMCVSVGAGLPGAALGYVPPDVRIVVVGEGGQVGGLDTCRNASSDCIPPVKATYWGCEESYAMLRGGHVHLAAVEATEVSCLGVVSCSDDDSCRDTADRAAAAAGTRLVVAMTHRAADGKLKIIAQSALPPAEGTKRADLIVTEKAVFTVCPEGGGLTLIELADGVTIEEVVLGTGCEFQKAKVVMPMQQVPLPESQS